MKKVISYALIAVLLMNTMGYYAIFMGLQYKNNMSMAERLDKNQYDESQAVTIKIPMSVPYLNEDSEFERVDGTFDYQGETYRLVKQKYVNDALLVVCVKDAETTRINNAITEYVMSFTDNGNDDSSSTITISLIKDYIAQSFSILTTSFGWQQDVINDIYTNNLIPSFTASVIHPPEQA